jgi:hypothetical protein
MVKKKKFIVGDDEHYCLQTPTMKIITINNKSVPLTLRRSARASRISLKIDSSRPELILTAPKWALGIEIQYFLSQHSKWIERHWNKVEVKSKKRPRFNYDHGDTFYYFGEAVSLIIQPSQFKRTRVKVRAEQMIVSVAREYLNVKDKKEIRNLVKNAIEAFYKEKAMEVIYDRLDHFNQYYGFVFRRVTFRNQKTRWGSCSAAKNLNFNWRLIMAPIEVIDYVVVHELCHLKQMNHSPKFWDLVAQMIPNYKSAQRWLSDNSVYLNL